MKEDPAQHAEAFYFEDLCPGFAASSGPCRVTEAEILEFGKRFDPRPFHVDAEAAKQSVFGGLVAPGCLIFAMRSRLVNQLKPPIAYQAGLGLENMQLPNPVRPEDQLFLKVECIERRESKSRPDAGIVRLSNVMTNQTGEVVLTMVANVLVAKMWVAKQSPIDMRSE